MYYTVRPRFRYDAPSPLFAGDWGPGECVAVGSFSETNSNAIYALQVQSPPVTQPGMITTPTITPIASAKVRFPVTKLSWEPFSGPQRLPKLLSSSDALRMYEIGPQGSLNELFSLTKRSKTALTSAPLTSFHWNPSNPSMAITSSIDTTCTCWDLNTQSVTTQLIAHDHEVFDVSFLPLSIHQFVSVGADGSARLFDLRALNNSTIVYETEGVPLLRCAPNPRDANQVCVFGQDQLGISVLDLRATRNPLVTLHGHQAPVNAMKWLPDGGWLATGGDDCQLLVWDVSLGQIIGCQREPCPVNNVFVGGGCLACIEGNTMSANERIQHRTQ